MLGPPHQYATDGGPVRVHAQVQHRHGTRGAATTQIAHPRWASAISACHQVNRTQEQAVLESLGCMLMSLWWHIQLQVWVYFVVGGLVSAYRARIRRFPGHRNFRASPFSMLSGTCGSLWLQGSSDVLPERTCGGVAAHDSHMSTVQEHLMFGSCMLQVSAVLTPLKRWSWTAQLASSRERAPRTAVRQLCHALSIATVHGTSPYCCSMALLLVLVFVPT